MSEWADRHAVLTKESSADPGQWNTISYQKAIMDAFVHPAVQDVILKKSKRVGWTKIVGHIFGYHVHQAPTSVLIVQPTIHDAEGYSKEEIQPMIDETPVLRNLVFQASSRKAGNTILKKRYPGGILHLIGANSPTGFRRITVQIVLFDEIDGYPATAGVEGDQIKLGMGRTETFWNRKHGLGSTPTLKDASRIDRYFMASSRGYPILRCPFCRGEHIRRFKFEGGPSTEVKVRGEKLAVSYLVWDEGDPSSAQWLCPHCDKFIDHSHHRHMIAGLTWLGEDWDWTESKGLRVTPRFAGRIGFAIWAGYSLSPNATPANIVQDYEEAKEDQELLVVFVNTVLGECWEEKGEQLATHNLEERVEDYSRVPNEVVCITAGADVQANRVEYEVIGWGPGEESWSLDYVILPGDITEREFQLELEEALGARYAREDGREMEISAVCIDRGYLPKAVDEFVERYRGVIWGVNGKEGFDRPVVESREKKRLRMRKMKKRRAPKELIGVDDAKLILHRRLKLLRPGPGYCHFGPHCDKEYFDQLTGEKLIKEWKGGELNMRWKRTRRQVEVLDNRNYGYAAMLLFEVDLMGEPIIAIDRSHKPRPDDFRVI